MMYRATTFCLLCLFSTIDFSNGHEVFTNFASHVATIDRRTVTFISDFDSPEKNQMNSKLIDFGFDTLKIDLRYEFETYFSEVDCSNGLAAN